MSREQEKLARANEAFFKEPSVENTAALLRVLAILHLNDHVNRWTLRAWLLEIGKKL